jgi:hypothetical protein
MLPITRCDEHLYPVPKFDLGKGDVRDDFTNNLLIAFTAVNPEITFSTTCRGNSANWSANPSNQ